MMVNAREPDDSRVNKVTSIVSKMTNNTIQTRRLNCGLDLHCVTDIANSVVVATSSGYGLVIAPIAHQRLYREFLNGKCEGKNSYFTRADLVLGTQEWNTFIVGKISPWINLDSAVESVRKNSEKALEQELNYAVHLGLFAVILKPKNINCVNMARLISNRLQASAAFQGMFQVYIHIPMQDPALFSEANNQNGGETITDVEACDPWKWWNVFRTVCGSEKRLGIALELSADLPPAESIKRWLGEPVRCLIVPTSIFLTNKKGFPVLPREHQSLVKEFFKFDVKFVISGANRHEHIKHYAEYMQYLWNTQPPEDTITQYARGYEDYLQIPLQPLMDNLESCTYEVFEKDPIKYIEYQNAVYQALMDRVSEEEKETKVSIVMVVGAGRGPLVQESLTAAEKAGRKIRVYAIEKNPNAVLTLLSHKEDYWLDKVTVVSCDMRDWKAPEKADIIVSELLGSFGDNELSPECLDGAQEFLNDDGIIIPESYSSFLGPIQSQKLYLEASQAREKDKPIYTSLETPYVVRIHNKMEIAPPQKLFSFHHPKLDKTDDNTRYKKLTFEVGVESVLHGFAGYFETVLYKDVKLSIVPETHSEGMFSWFPIYFPIREPVYVTANTTIEVHFWRCRNRKNVWYEYCVTNPISGSIHNPNGRSYTIGL